ncbi:hypothetical protein JHD46_08100, partial [Sulfurimonas sp. SAG-AH-194-C20]|nr:hypothetical protein [Sulfurimonas sp. SAG-AH-194-C20]
IQETNKLTNKQKLLTSISQFLDHKDNFDIDDTSNYTLYKLATKVNIKVFLLYIDAYYAGGLKEKVKELRDKAKKLHILTEKLPVLLHGKDIITLGLSPSKKFSEILLAGYEAQMREEFTTKKGAIQWLKNYTQ